MNDAAQIPQNVRREDLYQHIDMGFLNERLALSALPQLGRDTFQSQAKAGDDHFTQLSNQHLLVTLLIDTCDWAKVPTLSEALTLGKPTHMFRSVERLSPCPGIYDQPRVEHDVILQVDFGKPVKLVYHTTHLKSDTGRMTLSKGGYPEAMIGLVHDRGDHFEIEPIVIGAPTLGHPRNAGADQLMWYSLGYGEILPEDIDQFANMTAVVPASTEEWMTVMQRASEEHVKKSFASLLKEPTKKDWGGESNDHYSAAVTVGGRRKTAAFLLKGPSHFREMTLDMCGARADQIYRLTNSGADISVVQHSHQIGEAVRNTVKALVVYPGRSRKFCIIDGQETYRILKANNLLPGTV